MRRAPTTAPPATTADHRRIVPTASTTGGSPHAVAYFDRVRAAFAAAAHVTGTIERRVALGGVVVRLRFAGPALVPAMTAALAPLATDLAHSPDVTIDLFDGATGGSLPPAAWGPAAYGPRGEIRGFNDARIRTVYDAGDHTFRLADLARGAGVFWIRDAATVPYWERGAPLRTVLHWLCGSRGLQLVHAAAVGTPNGGLLLAGKGGAGKSTSALACLGSRLGYLGDDYVLLAPGQPATVHALYATAKVHAEQLVHFPALRAAIDNPGSLATEKALLFPARIAPEAFQRTFPLRAILIPHLTGTRATRVVAASPAAALAALAPTTIFQLPGEGRRTFAMLATLVRTTPCHGLALGTDLARLPDVLAEVLGAC